MSKTRSLSLRFQKVTFIENGYHNSNRATDKFFRIYTRYNQNFGNIFYRILQQFAKICLPNSFQKMRQLWWDCSYYKSRWNNVRWIGLILRRGERYYLNLEYKNVWILTSEIKNEKFKNSLIHSLYPKIKTLSQPWKYRFTGP